MNTVGYVFQGDVICPPCMRKISPPCGCITRDWNDQCEKSCFLPVRPIRKDINSIILEVDCAKCKDPNRKWYF